MVKLSVLIRKNHEMFQNLLKIIFVGQFSKEPILPLLATIFAHFRKIVLLGLTF